MGKKRILGADRALMFLCRAARKYWRFYCEAYKDTKKASICNGCGKWVPYVEVDHVIPVGPRPRKFDDMGVWLHRLFYLPVQGLCIKHHKQKTKKERSAR